MFLPFPLNAALSIVKPAHRLQRRGEVPLPLEGLGSACAGGSLKVAGQLKVRALPIG